MCSSIISAEAPVPLFLAHKDQDNPPIPFLWSLVCSSITVGRDLLHRVPGRMLGCDCSKHSSDGCGYKVNLNAFWVFPSKAACLTL